MQQLDLKRVIIFTGDIDKLAAFHRDVIGLKIVGQESGRIDFAAGPCNLALHAASRHPANGRPSSSSTRPTSPPDVSLVKRGAKDLGTIKSAKTFDMCDGRDPDGPPIQVSSRK